METENELFERIRKELQYRKIETLDFNYSIYNKRLIVIINGEKFDIGDRVSNDIWNIADSVYKSPVDTYKITSEVTRITRKFINEFDPTFDVERIIGMG